MSDDTYYITTHEAALAVVATAMKKSRLRLDTLIMTSILGGALFSAGGMAFILVQAGFQGLYETNPAVVHLLQGAVYPIGLFYVVIMGTDLYNSNVLFFTVGVLRGAVSILDLMISWSVSFLFNLLGNLFVVYVLCHLSKSTTDDDWVKASIQLVDTKLSFSFAENLIKGIPCNFLVAMAIYLQLMVKPLHVKFLMMFTPVFIFVSMGFNHVVADMFVIPIGLLNGADCSVGKYIWRSMIPSAIGNAIGGCAFAVMIPWYLHLFVVEMDKKKLNLPEYDERDEQPEQGMDSRVVRVPSHISTASSPTLEDDDISTNSRIEEKLTDGDLQPMAYDPIHPIMSHKSVHSVKSTSALSRSRTSSARLRLVKSRNSAEAVRSPRGVFPVYGMGAPYLKERKITDPYSVHDGDDHQSAEYYDAGDFTPNKYDPETEKLSGNLRRILSRKRSDITTRDEEARPGMVPNEKSHIFKSNFNLGTSAANNNYYNISRRASQAGLTRNAVRMSDDVAGIHPQSINIGHHMSVDAATLRLANEPRSRASIISTKSNKSQRTLKEKRVGSSGLQNTVDIDSSNNSDDIHDDLQSVDSQMPEPQL